MDYIFFLSLMHPFHYLLVLNTPVKMIRLLQRLHNPDTVLIYTLLIAIIVPTNCAISLCYSVLIRIRS